MQQVELKAIFLTCILLFVGCIGTETEAQQTSPYNGYEWTGANPAPLFTWNQ